MKNLSKYVWVAASIVSPFMAFAATPGEPSALADVTGITGIYGILCTLFNWAFLFFFLIAILFILYAAFKYLTAGGDPKAVETATHMLKYAIIAIVVALLAKFLPGIIQSFVGGAGAGAGAYGC